MLVLLLQSKCKQNLQVVLFLKITWLLVLHFKDTGVSLESRVSFIKLNLLQPGTHPNVIRTTAPKIHSWSGQWWCSARLASDLILQVLSIFCPKIVLLLFEDTQGEKNPKQNKDNPNILLLIQLTQQSAISSRIKKSIQRNAISGYQRSLLLTRHVSSPPNWIGSIAI